MTVGRDLFKSLLLTGLFVWTSACSGSESSLKWKEDVLLPDGRIVTLTRFQEFKRPSELFTPKGPSYHWFEFKHLENGEVIRWEDKGDLGTVALLIQSAAPYLLVKPYYGSSIRDFDCPNPPYLLFKYREKNGSACY